MKKKYLILALVIIAAVLSISIFFQEKRELGPISNIKLKVAFTKNDPGSAPLYIALEKGYFQQEGLEIEPLYVNSGKEALNTLLSNDAHLAFISETNLAYLSFADKSVQIISEVTQKKDNKVLVRKDRGINQLSDLKGKKIATPKGTSPEFALEKALKSMNIRRFDFEWVNLSPQNLLPALYRGEIDAYAIWEPHIQNGIKLLGDNALVLLIPDYSVKISAAGKRTFLANNPTAVKKFLTALLLSEKFLLNYPEESQTIVSKYISVDKDTLGLIWSDYTFRIQITPSLISLLQEEGEWINEQKAKEEQGLLPNYFEFINESFLKEIDISRVK